MAKLGDRNFRRYKTVVELRLDALADNVQAIASRVGALDRIIAVLKSNAYGLGADRVSMALRDLGIGMLAVANVDEAVSLREAGWDRRIMLFAPVSTLRNGDMKVCQHYQLEPTIGSDDCCNIVSPLNPDIGNLIFHINVDCGMNRYGLVLPKSSFGLRRLQRISDQIGSVYTHLPFHDQADSPRMLQCIAGFANQLPDLTSVPRHLASTAACSTLPPEQLASFDFTRIGLGLFGYLPNDSFPDIGLTPIVNVTTRIDLVRSVRAGEGLSYEHDYLCLRDSKIAVIPFGYSHGLPRQASGNLIFDIAGMPVPQVGRITMDSCLIDVTDVPDVFANPEVTILGEHGRASTIYDWCRASDSSPWEILTRIGSQV